MSNHYKLIRRTEGNESKNGSIDLRSAEVVLDTSSIISLSHALRSCQKKGDDNSLLYEGLPVTVLPRVYRELLDHCQNHTINGEAEVCTKAMEFVAKNGTFLEGFDYLDADHDTERYCARLAEAGLQRHNGRGPLSDTDTEIIVYALSRKKPVIVLSEDGLLRDVISELSKSGCMLDKYGNLHGNGYKHVQLGTYMDLFRYIGGVNNGK